jgi:hypothetical protein
MRAGKHLLCAMTGLAVAVFLLEAGCSKGSETSQQPAATASESAGGGAAGTPAAGQPAAGQPAAAQPPAGSPAAGAERSSAEAVGTPAARNEAPPPPPEVTLPEGTPLSVRTTSTLSTKTQQAGEAFTATLVEPLRADGRVIAPRGAEVEGKIVEANPGGRVKGVAVISVELTRLRTASGRNVPITSNTVTREAPTTKKKDAEKVGIGAAVGAAIGAIAGGGKGAAIGAAAGGGAGGGYALATRGAPAVIPSETVLRFRLRSPVTVRE